MAKRISKTSWQVFGMWNGAVSICFVRDGVTVDMWTFHNWSDVLPALQDYVGGDYR